MSLVSCLTNYGMPVIVSDLVLTSTEEIEPVMIPIRNKTFSTADFANFRTPYSYKLKTLIVQGTLCIGFTGEVVGIKQMALDIEDYFLHRKVTPSTLASLLSEIDGNEKYTDVNAFFVLGRPDISPYTVQTSQIGEWHVLPNVRFDHAITSGSGTEEWEKILQEHLPYYDAGPKINVRDLVQKVLPTCMYLIEEERVSPDNLRAGFGGGYDIIYYDNGIFQRLNNVAYLSLDIDISGKEQKIIPKSVIQYKYINDTLFIQHFNGMHITDENHQRYQLTTFTGKVDSDEISKSVDWPASIVASCIRIVKNGEDRGKILAVNGQINGEHIFHTLEIEGRLGFGFSLQFNDELSKIVKEFTT